MSNKEFRIENLELRIFFPIILIIAFSGCSKSNNENNSIKFQQYYVQGELLYQKHCSNCHQENGTGLGLVFPPLNQSDFMEKNFEQVLCLMKYGVNSEIMVNGKSYVQPMPGVQSLTDLEIAEIATYIYNSWEHQRGIIEVNTVSQLMKSCTPVSTVIAH
jgi:cytochrome c551